MSCLLVIILMIKFSCVQLTFGIMQLLIDNFLFDFHMYCEQRHCVSLFSTTFSSMLEQETKHSIVLEGRNRTLLWSKGSPC